MTDLPRAPAPAASPRAVVLLSGGLDSATCLAIAHDMGFEPHALSVAYGQRHTAELNAAKRVAEALGVVCAADTDRIEDEEECPFHVAGPSL